MEYSHSSRINTSEHCEPITNSMFSQNNGTESVSAQCDIAIKTHAHTHECVTSNISYFLGSFSCCQSESKNCYKFSWGKKKKKTLFPCRSLPLGIAGLKCQIYKNELK